MGNGSWVSANESGDVECVEVGAYLESDLTSVPAVRVAFAALYALIFAVGLVGNVTMLLCIVRSSKLFHATSAHSPLSAAFGRSGDSVCRRSRGWSVANIFLGNLGLSDILLCLTAVPLTPVQIMAKRWIFGAFLCRLTPFTQGSCPRWEVVEWRGRRDVQRCRW